MIRGKSHQAMSVIKSDAEETSGSSAKLVCLSPFIFIIISFHFFLNTLSFLSFFIQLSTIGALALTDLVKSTLGPKGMVCDLLFPSPFCFLSFFFHTHV